MKLFFARDPGAANVVGAAFLASTEPKLLYAKDAARKIFSELGVPFKDFNREVVDRDLQASDIALVEKLCETVKASTIVTGTTHFDDMTDRLLWRAAEKRKIKTLAILDQWLRVTERFLTPQGDFFPGALMAPDEEIAERARAVLPKSTRILVASHPYLYDLKTGRWPAASRARDIRPELSKKFGVTFERLVVLASEPQRMLIAKGSQFSDIQDDETTMIALTRASLENSRWADKTLLIVKPHPKQDAQELEKFHPYVDGVSNKWDLLRSADLVVGHKSMLLIEAAMLGLPTLSLKLNPQAKDENLITVREGLTQEVHSREEASTWLDLHWKVSTSAKLPDALNLEHDWRNTLEEFFGT